MSGKTPAIVLENPKYPRNVGMVLRSAYNFGIAEIWVTGNRVSFEGTDTYRLPREERFKEYTIVPIYRDEKPIDKFQRGTTIIGVELIPGAMPLAYFEHPEKAVYVFGPEDGSISKGLRTKIHQFIFIPTLSCLNLAVAAPVIFYDRLVKQQLAGKEPVRSMEETLSRYNSLKEQLLIDSVDPR